MESRETGIEPTVAGTPEDVAALYSWANLRGAKYRDFSASRREYRAQIRYRAAQALRQRELQAQSAAETAAAAAERAALAAEAAARTQNSSDSQVLRLHALRSAEAAARTAAAERVEAARLGEAAAQAGVVAEREEREIAEAHASAQRQALNYSESEVRRRQLAGPQPRVPFPGENGDPDIPDGQGHVNGGLALDEDSGERAAGSRQFLHSGRYRAPVEPESGSGSALNLAGLAGLSWEAGSRRRPQGYRPDNASGVWDLRGPAAGTAVSRAPERRWDTAGEEALGAAPVLSAAAPGGPDPDQWAMGRALRRVAEGELELRGPRVEVDSKAEPRLNDGEPGANFESNPHSKPDADFDFDDGPAGPAWLYAPQKPPQRTRVAQGVSQPQGGETLQSSRELVAARWFALQGVFEHAGPELPAMQPALPGETRTPLLLVFSLAGGVGKTSMVATLGRALSSQGEKVLLTDTTSHGLLPFYFGARELRQGVMRTFSPPSGSSGVPIYLLSYEMGGNGHGERQQEALTEDIFRNAQDNHRVVLDLSMDANWLIRRMADLHPTVLVPVTPDMNSVIGVQAVERFFQGIVDADGRPLLPFYVLNQFDATLPLHLDVREVFRRQLGDRLLNLVVRRSPAVSEALAEGMTVVDYAPEAPVSKDYFDVARWLQTISPPATEGFRAVRWSEPRWSEQ